MPAKRLKPLDSVFLANETRETMMHVGALIPFTPPPDAPKDFLRPILDELRSAARVEAPWNWKLRSPDWLTNPLQAWVEDETFDLDYHVRRSALPSPGDERELGILVSRLHSHAMDFHRPLWELHFIEGLANGRFAIYLKVHHALVDGFTGMKMLARSLRTDPADRSAPMFYAVPPRVREADAAERPGLTEMLELARSQILATKDASRALAKLARSGRTTETRPVGPLSSPKSILNARIGRSRRFATQQFRLERLRRVAKAVDGTVNDVTLAITSSAIRRLLTELSALPEEPLTTMVPVNLRPKDDPGGGNAVGAILASLATDVDDPEERLRAIVRSTRAAKDQLRGLTRDAIFQYSALLMAPLAIEQVTRTAGRVRPAFNVVISNVPGPTEPLYFRGARMEALYPLSIPFHGNALNVTISGYADTLNFGFTGCRDTVPHLQRLAVYGAEALDEMERVLGLRDDVGAPSAPSTSDPEPLLSASAMAASVGDA